MHHNIFWLGTIKRNKIDIPGTPQVLGEREIHFESKGDVGFAWTAEPGWEVAGAEFRDSQNDQEDPPNRYMQTEESEIVIVHPESTPSVIVRLQVVRVRTPWG